MNFERVGSNYAGGVMSMSYYARGMMSMSNDFTIVLQEYLNNIFMILHKYYDNIIMRVSRVLL